ncbi:hypothetical protein RYX36_002744 [Vicia faba]
MIVAYGSRILNLPNVADVYTYKFKGIWICLTILSRALSENYVNFGVFELYGDRALSDALDAALKLTLSIPMSDILAYRNLTKAYFAFLEVLFYSHLTFILSLDTNTFVHLVGSLESGLKGLDTTDDTWSPHAFQTSKFSHQFAEEEKKSVEDLTPKPNDLLSLVIGGEKGGLQVSNEETTHHVALNSGFQNPEPAGERLPNITCTSISNSELSYKSEVLEILLTVLICEDLEQTILSQGSGSGLSSQ